MKNSFFYMGIILLLAISVLNADCGTNAPEPDFPTYHYTNNIADPPDVFQIIYDVSSIGDKLAHVAFEKDAVWLIERIGDSRINFWANNDTEDLFIASIDTLGLKAGHTYIFGANNNNYTEFSNFYVKFSKLTIDYDTFEPKF